MKSQRCGRFSFQNWWELNSNELSDFSDSNQNNGAQVQDNPDGIIYRRICVNIYVNSLILISLDLQCHKFPWFSEWIAMNIFFHFYGLELIVIHILNILFLMVIPIIVNLVRPILYLCKMVLSHQIVLVFFSIYTFDSCIKKFERAGTGSIPFLGP